MEQTETWVFRKLSLCCKAYSVGLNIFSDNSNLWRAGRGVCHTREPGEENDFGVHFGYMLDCACDNRQVDYAFVGRSIPPNNDPLWQRFNNLGVDVVKQERGRDTGDEVAVDEIIQLRMANRVLDVGPIRSFCSPLMGAATQVAKGLSSSWSDRRIMDEQLKSVAGMLVAIGT